MNASARGFIARHELWTDEQKAAADELRKRVAHDGVQSIRVAFADQHGTLRGKTYTTQALGSLLAEGCALTSTLLLKDTSHRTAFPIWRAKDGLDPARLVGASDFILVPDPLTYRPVPWAAKSGWLLCDAYYRDGSPVPFSTRHVLRSVLTSLGALGQRYLAGIELEFSLYRLVDARLTHEDCTHPATPPEVRPLTHGYQHLTEGRYDELEPLLETVRESLVGIGLPLRTLEVEFGPSQVELTFDPVVGLEGADQAVLTRSAIKQVCRRHGYHATFMTRPAFPNAFASGWHLHQSLIDAGTGHNAFVSESSENLLSPVGQHFLAGLLAHAKESCLLTTPTINGYKRYSRAYALAPNRIVWGKDNRGAMLRVVGEPGDPATRIENRVGESAANPYLYFASQVICGVQGMQQRLPPPPIVDAPYDESWERLPRNIAEAIAHFRGSALFRRVLGDAFVDYFCHIKEFELNRFLGEEVTDWEQREYFANF